jgi:two-component system, LytTR family, sensor kinase
MRPNPIEWKTYFFLMPGLLLVLNYLLFEERLWQDHRIWLFSFPVIAIASLGSWYTHILVMHWLRERFSDWRQTTARVLILGFSHIILTALTFSVFFYSYDYFQFLDYEFNLDNYTTALMISIALTMVATTLWEADYIFSKWKETLAEKERLQQLNIMREFDSLKNQVNPHFLFNCFNALSSLINEDKKQAEVFVDELSKVYRYLLKSNQDGLSTLENEIKFINSYFKLLQTRYGDGLQMQIEVDKRYLQYLIPSLTLQMLVENAVKHNVVLKRNPLTIDIFTAAGNLLVVNNNLQPRQSTSASKSGKVGLENIKTKYQLMNMPGFQVMKDNKNFSVVCPLIWSQVADKHVFQTALAAG